MRNFADSIGLLILANITSYVAMACAFEIEAWGTALTLSFVFHIMAWFAL